MLHVVWFADSRDEKSNGVTTKGGVKNFSVAKISSFPQINRYI